MIWDVLAWDLTALQTGHLNEKRHDKTAFKDHEFLAAVKGQAVVNGSVFAAIQLKQDWEHLCNVEWNLRGLRKDKPK